MSDFELPGMWESADFMGGRTDCEPLKPHPSSDAWQQMIDAVEELTAKTAYQEDDIDRLTAERDEARKIAEWFRDGATPGVRLYWEAA